MLPLFMDWLIIVGVCGYRNFYGIVESLARGGLFLSI